MGLIFSRKTSERVRIGDDIVVTILAIRGNRVRVVVDAPIEVPVHREEVYDRIKREGPRKGDT